MTTRSRAVDVITRASRSIDRAIERASDRRPGWRARDRAPREGVIDESELVIVTPRSRAGEIPDRARAIARARA